MILKCVRFDLEEKEIEAFLSLADKLYPKNNMQNKEELKSLLKEEHILSKYFSLAKFNIYEEDTIVGRFILTSYEKDSTLYLGFFECVEDEKVASFLFTQAYEYAKENGYQKIVGPVDASFWIKYRMKINLFENAPYTGEPYNLPYYERLFLENDYHRLHHYTSYHYESIDTSFQPEKYEKRYQEFLEKGYEIVSPKMDSWDQTIREIYTLLTDLYQDFPIFKPISEEDFVTYFKSYQKIVDLSMIKVAYFHQKLVGFFISVPNYQNLVYHTNRLTNLFKILRIRRQPKEYVMLYMGVDQDHQGLGKALVEAIVRELGKKKVPSIGALMKDGKITQSYVLEKVKETYEYILLERNIEK